MKKNAALWTIFFASGAAALGWQVLWSKLFALSLGHEFASVVAVVVSFFAGMAIGGWIASRRIVELWKLEALIGVWGLLTPLFVSWSASRWTVLAMLPGTIAMGATLPAMKALARRGIAGVYAANTFGGVMGCLGTAFVLLPALDFWKVSCVLAGVNCIAAIGAFALRGVHSTEKAAASSKGLEPLFFATGFLALGFEVVGVRLLSQSLENTIFSFASILAVYLLGQAIGAGTLWRLQAKTLFVALGCSVVISIWLFQWSGSIYQFLRSQFGDASRAVAAAELLVTIVVFGPPTILMGGLFVSLAQKANSIGSAICWNSLGAGIGAAIFPVILPTVGGFGCLAILTFGYLILSRDWRWIVAAGVLVFVAPRPLTLARIWPGQKIFAFKEGRMANVLVTESPDGNRTLFVNNRFQMGGTAARIPELRHAHLPLLLGREPKRALFIGLGTGISLSGAGAFPEVQADGIELLAEVAAAISHFVPAMPSNARIHVADARRFIRETTNRYDAVVGDLFHPAQDGAGFLYTREHFERVRGVLNGDGIFCQWLPMHQLDVETFRTIVRTFLSVFPRTDVYLLRPNIDAPVIGLIGWNGARPKMSEGEIRNEESRRLGLTDFVRVHGNYLAGEEELARFAADGKLNTDFHPVVVFEAPRFSYLRQAPTHERLMALLEGLGPAKVGNARIEKFIRARDVYLRALVTEHEGNQERAIDRYVESARMSEDFTLGYAQGLTLASAWLKADPKSERARQLLQRLAEAQPRQRIAREMLERLR